MLEGILFMHEQTVEYNQASTDYTVRSIYKGVKGGQILLYGLETVVATAGGVPVAIDSQLNDAYTWFGITPP